MKNIIIIVVLVLLVGGFIIMNKKGGTGSSDTASSTGEAIDLSSAPTEGAFVVDTAASVINWSGSKTLIVNYVDKGTLKVKSGKVVLKDGAPVSGEIVIDMNTIHTLSTGKGSGESAMENHLKSADFFDVAKYPEAKFVAKSGKQTGDNAFDLVGDLTIKGITKEVTIPVTVANLSKDGATVNGKITLDRTLWDIRYGSGKFFKSLGDNVIDDMFTVEFAAVFKAEGSAAMQTASVGNINKTNQDKIMQATLKTNKGDIVIEFLPEQAPNTVANFTKLAGEGFYNGTKFHRVIKGFMIQGGDPLTKDDAQMARWGTGGPGYQFADEISKTNSNDVGTISMANAGPNTNGSQFFINVANNSFLNPKHTVFGKVVKGMEVVTAIENVATVTGDRPAEPVVITSVTLN